MKHAMFRVENQIIDRLTLAPAVRADLPDTHSWNTHMKNANTILAPFHRCIRSSKVMRVGRRGLPCEVYLYRIDHDVDHDDGDDVKHSMTGVV